jgi:hypothetical protein
MRKIWTMGRTFALIAALVAIGPATSEAGWGAKSLKGNYAFGVAGFELDSNADFGEVAGVGLLGFNGAGGVTSADLTFSGADNNGNSDFNFDNYTCQPILSVGSYSVNSNGTGTMALVFTDASPCFAAGEIDFFFALANGNGMSQIVSTTFSSTGLMVNTTPTPETILSMVLQGQLQMQKRKKSQPVDP